MLIATFQSMITIFDTIWKSGKWVNVFTVHWQCLFIEHKQVMNVHVNTLIVSYHKEENSYIAF